MAKKPSKPPALKSSSRPQVVTTKKSKKPLVILAVIFTTVMCAALAIGVYFYFQNKPEKVLADALTSTFVDIAKGVPANSAHSFTLEIKGDQPAKVTFLVGAKTAGQAGEYEVAAALTFKDKTQNLKASVIAVDSNELYFKIHDFKNSMDTFAGSSAEAAAYRNKITPLITKIDGKWVKVSAEDTQLADEQSIQKCAQALTNLELSKENEKQLKELFKKNQFVSASEVLGSEEVGGEKSFHYKLRVDPVAGASFFNQASTLDFLLPLKTQCNILNQPETKQLFAQMKEAVSKDPNLIPEVELWVGKKTRRITKIRINMNNNKIAANLSSEITFNTQTIEVEPPTQSIPLNTISNDLKAITGN